MSIAGKEGAAGLPTKRGTFGARMVSFGHMEHTGLVRNEAGQQLFTAYGRDDQSPVLAWLPILLGLLASAVVALTFCPVPRTQTVSAVGALLLAVAYVAATVGIGAAAVAACGVIVARRKREVSIWGILPFFSCVAAWMTPLVAFYMRDSLWAVLAGLVVSILGSRLIYRYHLASMVEMFASSAESRTDRSHSTRLISLTLAALVLEFGALSTAASMARPATVLISCAIVVLSFFRESANQPQLKLRFPNALPSSIGLGLAIIMVAASLTPYLAFPTDDEDGGAGSGQSITQPALRSAKRKVSLTQYVSSLFRRSRAHDSQQGTQGRHVGRASTDRPYPALQALFGEGNTAGGTESTYRAAKSKTRKSTALVAGDSEPGVIVRPEITDHVAILPPLPAHRVFDGRPNERTTDPVSIPFYGVYWVFKASDQTLPAGAVEMRGDPASISFKTTDFSPISMEARQSFGSLINLSCCSAIELVISNGDRRPGTVRVELTLADTTLPGQPLQSLGILPVNSTLHWFPGDDRPPVPEVLSFRLPAHLAIQCFDEATIRFEMQSPRERWSAKIAVEKFRLIPRLL